MTLVFTVSARPPLDLAEPTRLSPVKWCYKVESLFFGSTLKNLFSPLGDDTQPQTPQSYFVHLRPPDFDLVPRKQMKIYHKVHAFEAGHA